MVSELILDAVSLPTPCAHSIPFTPALCHPPCFELLLLLLAGLLINLLTNPPCFQLLLLVLTNLLIINLLTNPPCFELLLLLLFSGALDEPVLCPEHHLRVDMSGWWVVVVGGGWWVTQVVGDMGDVGGGDVSDVGGGDMGGGDMGGR